MRADFTAVLDACVLLPMPPADTLLRMAERPRLYVPKWSLGDREENSDARTREKVTVLTPKDALG
jgi:hypothetical protein